MKDLQNLTLQDPILEKDEVPDGMIGIKDLL